MKTLLESILGSNNIGIQATIKRWCADHNVQEPHSFNSKNEIVYNSTIVVELDFSDYDELPEYIKFAPNSDVSYRINTEKTNTQIKSFRGLPDVCGKMWFRIKNQKQLPPLKITCSFMHISDPFLNTLKGFDVAFYDDSHRPWNGKLSIKDDQLDDLTSIKLTGIRSLDVVNDFSLGDKFSKLMARKAELNKSRNRYEFPAKPEVHVVINNFFSKDSDLSQLHTIQYTQQSQLKKHNGEWYRWKNW